MEERLKMSDTCSRIRLCSTDDVDWDSAIRVEEGDLVLAVFNINGTFYVTDDLCTHGPGSLAEGYTEGEEIECPFHQGRFNVISGQPTSAPCTVPLRTWAVTLRDGKIYIDAAQHETSGA